MKIKKILLLFAICAIPLKVFAVEWFELSKSNISIYEGETETIELTTGNAVGILNVSSSDISFSTTFCSSVPFPDTSAIRKSSVSCSGM